MDEPACILCPCCRSMFSAHRVGDLCPDCGGRDGETGPRLVLSFTLLHIADANPCTCGSRDLYTAYDLDKADGGRMPDADQYQHVFCRSCGKMGAAGCYVKGCGLEGWSDEALAVLAWNTP